jgi:hypothetical protein
MIDVWVRVICRVIVIAAGAWALYQIGRKAFERKEWRRHK